jgi:hypothetical protein
VPPVQPLRVDHSSPCGTHCVTHVDIEYPVKWGCASALEVERWVVWFHSLCCICGWVPRLHGEKREHLDTKGLACVCIVEQSGLSSGNGMTRQSVDGE